MTYTCEEIIEHAFSLREQLQAYAYAAVRDWSAADDVVQEAYVVAMRRWQDVEDLDGVFPWMRRIVRLKSLEAMRARGKSPAMPGDDVLADAVMRALDEHGSAHVRDEQRQLQNALHTCMDGLATHHKSLLESFYWDKVSCEDLARQMGKKAEALRVMLHRLRKKLHDCVQQRVEHHG